MTMTLAPSPVSANADLVQRFAAIIGERYVLTNADDMAPFLKEERDLWHGKAICVLRPASTQEVSQIMKLCYETNTSVVPQGGNTGLVGGQTPDTSGNQVVLSLGRMDKVREIDTASNTATIEAGLQLIRVQEVADGVDRIFPMAMRVIS